MGNTIFKNLISVVILASVFITGNGFAGSFFTFYWYYGFYFLFILYGFLVYRRIDKRILLCYVALIIYAALTLQFEFEGLVQSTKQIFNIGVSLFVFYFFLLHEKFDLESITRKYIIISKIILIVGFIQVFLFAIDQGKIFLLCFSFLSESNITFRFQSVTQEPSFLALVFAPVVFISIYSLISRKPSIGSITLTKIWSILFIVGYILTLSISAFFGIGIIILIVLLNKGNFRNMIAVMVISIGLLFSFLILYNNFPFLKVRIHDTIIGLQEDVTVARNYKKFNLSTYSLLSNIEVMKGSLREHPLVGNGLGSHPLSFEKYLPEDMIQYSSLNSKDGCGLAIRLLSETGLIGFVCFLIFVVRYRISSKNLKTNQEFYWVINSAILVMIFVILLRNGNYTIHGKMLFLMMYYFTFEKIKNAKKNNSGISHFRA